MRAADDPFDAAALRRRFAPLEAAGRLALAVSGGADLLALLVLADRWRQIADPAPDLLVLTVDHGLRAEAAAEAGAVAALAGRMGLSSRILRWKGPHPEADIEAAAREARYRLLVEAARQSGASHLLTAHHRDDQAETFLLRLARGSGVYGLAAMAAVTDRGGVTLVRPLLDLARTELAAIAAGAGLEPADDPHNRDPRFARARMRSLMPALAAEGLDAATLAGTAGRLRRAAAAVDHYVERLLDAAAGADAMGAVRLAEAPWLAEPAETRLRALSRILRAVGGAAYGPPLDSLEGLASAVLAEAPGRRFRRTLGGVVVERRAGELRFQREPGRTGLPVVAVRDRFDGVWDGRFALRLAVEGEPVTIGALGPGGRRQLAVCAQGALPLAMEGLPAVRRGETILAVPALAFGPAAGAGLTIEARPLVALRLRDPARNDLA